MEQNRIPKPGEIYIHFKKMHYQIVTVAIHSESRELMVVYQALYGDFKTYVRPLEMFLSEVDHIKYPEVKQKYRFERESSFEEKLYDNKHKIEEVAKIEETRNAKQVGEVKKKADSEKNLTQEEKNFRQSGVELISTLQGALPVETNQEIDLDSQHNSEMELYGEVNAILMEFLDETSYNKKLEVLLLNKKHLNDRLVNDMAVALDLAVDEGPLEVRIQELVNCLSALSRFEHRRIR